MSFDFHTDKPKYFDYQYQNSRDFIIPFLEKTKKIEKGMKVLEIGSAEGGVLKAFTNIGCEVVGVELSEGKVKNANIFMKPEVDNMLAKFICKNIYDVDFENEFKNYFDIIILKDTIEHIHDQQKLISYLPMLLKPKGQLFFGFPAWYMPWGGHQQICKSKFLMFLPYFHILPMPIYKTICKFFGETDSKIEELVEIKETGISTLRFENILKKCNLKIYNRQIYLINPIYEHKFGWKPKKQASWIGNIPLLRDLLSTTVYYSIGCE